MGLPGFSLVLAELPRLIKDFCPDLLIVNAENAAQSGQGVSFEQVTALRNAGADVITTGNHVWESETLEKVLSEDRVLRPDNYSPRLPGKGWCLVEGPRTTAGVINLQGRLRMTALDDPFSRAEILVDQLKSKTPLLFVDFHAEAPDEKESMGYWLDGRGTAVMGTHTHVATTDLRILPLGTAFQTDLGMCGPTLSVIGGDAAVSVDRALTLIPHRNLPAAGAASLNGAFVVADGQTGRALRVERIGS